MPSEVPSAFLTQAGAFDARSEAKDSLTAKFPAAIDEAYLCFEEEDCFLLLKLDLASLADDVFCTADPGTIDLIMDASTVLEDLHFRQRMSGVCPFLLLSSRVFCSDSVR